MNILFAASALTVLAAIAVPPVFRLLGASR